MTIDKTVQTHTTPQGMVVWCASNPRWEGVSLTLSVAAGSSSDTTQVRGQARFLAKLLETRLNFPKNPARSLLPPGQGRYRVDFQKEWLHLHANLPKGGLHEALRHVAARLRESPTDGLPETLLPQIRKELLLSSGRFPAIPPTDRIDAFLYVNHPRGRFLRGRPTVFQNLRIEDLKAASSRLYRSDRSRLLLLGALDCKGLFSLTDQAFSALPGSSKPVLRPFQGPGRLENAPRGRLFLTHEIFSLYLLPQLQREDAIALDLTLAITQEEIADALRKRFGDRVPFTLHPQPHEEGGYLLFTLPNPPTLRKDITTLLRENLGKFLMSPYNPPWLEQRISHLLDEYRLDLLDSKEDIRRKKERLLSQILLPSDQPAPYDPLSFVDAVTPDSFRFLARRYLASPAPLVQSIQPFSFQRIMLFIGSLLALWFFLDLMIRRTRRSDE